MWHPQAGYWQQFAETELAAGNTDAMKSIFGRCLLHNLHVDLWRLYLRFIKQVGACEEPDTNSLVSLNILACASASGRAPPARCSCD